MNRNDMITTTTKILSYIYSGDAKYKVTPEEMWAWLNDTENNQVFNSFNHLEDEIFPGRNCITTLEMIKCWVSAFYLEKLIEKTLGTSITINCGDNELWKTVVAVHKSFATIHESDMPYLAQHDIKCDWNQDDFDNFFTEADKNEGKAIERRNCSIADCFDKEILFGHIIFHLIAASWSDKERKALD